jgi:apolipoprotein D and lipocalin family protein
MKLPVVVLAMLISACTTIEPLETVDHVDLDRFMGEWYVIASIPTFIETDAYNAIEAYRLDDDGTIDTVFTFLQGSFDGKPKRYNPRGFIRNSQTNAEWGMQFIWPFKSDYRIIDLDPEYRTTVIGRNKRDYVWIMAREPSIQLAEYDLLVSRVKAAGYDVSKLRKVPQQW